MTESNVLARADPRASQRFTIISYFANNPVAANLLMLLFLIGGFIASRGINTEIFPLIDEGIVSVVVPYPGATPSEVQESITQRIDEAVKGIDGVDRVVSQASEGVGHTIIELKDFVDSDEVRDEVESALDQLANFPPLDAEEPEVVASASLGPVMTLIVRSSGDEAHLDQGTRQIEEALLALPLVSHVTVSGLRDYEITIEVSETALRGYELTFDELSTAIASASVNLSSGEIRTESGDLLLRTDQQRYTAEEFENIVLRTLPGGSVLRLGDVATVVDGYADDELAVETDGERSAFLQIRKSDTENVLQIARQIHEFFDTYELPPGISVSIWEDQSSLLRSRLNLLVRNGALGFALVFIFLVLMLDLRLAFWVAMGVPISFLGGFLLFDGIGIDINMISLFALIIVLGLVVDDAIIVGESIDTESSLGLKGSAASVAGVRRVLSPVLVGVSTTMIAFTPLMLVGGDYGQFFGVVGAVVVVVLVISLVEVFFILPAHLAHGGRWSHWPLNRIQETVARGIMYWRDSIVVRGIRLAVKNRYLTVIYAVAFFTLAILFIANGAVRIEFFPQVESDALEVHLDFPVGTPFEVTDQAIRRIQNVVYEVNEELGGTNVRGVTLTSGARFSVVGAGPGANAQLHLARNIATLEVQLYDAPYRKVAAAELERRLRLKTGTVPGAESVSFSSELFGPANQLSYELIHEDDSMLENAVESLRGRLTQQPMIIEVSDTLSLGKRQLDIELTSEGEALGLTPVMVARQLRQSYFGEEVQRIQRGRDEVKVMLRYPQDARQSTTSFYDARIRLPDGSQVPFSSVARAIETRSYSAIDSVDGDRVLTVSAEVDNTYMATGDAASLIAQEVLSEFQQEFPEVRVNATGFNREQAENMNALMLLGALAIMVIFTIIAIQMRSYTLPLITITAIPFGIAGAIVGHFLLGFDLSIVSMFGALALCGVVVNDSVVLIDRFRAICQADPAVPVREAIVEAARLRFRAIFLTTVTTALGLTPMLFETSMQARFLVPMAVSLATGIVFASFIILFFIPAIVAIREDILDLGRRVFVR